MKIEKSIKNYIILALIVFLSIVVVIYFYLWHRAYEKERLNVSPVSECLNVIHYNELDNYLIENKDSIIYVSVSNDEKIYDFEKKFRRLINKYSLNNNILYLNITNELDNSSTFREIKNKYGVDIPYIIIIENGEIESRFNINDNNYDISLLKNYLYSEGIIND